MNNQSILVTGGAGFIGSNLIDALVKLGQHVVILDNFDDFYSPKRKEANLQKAKESGLVTVVSGDIRDGKCLAKVFKKHAIEKVVHLAALAGVRPSIINPKLYLEVNVWGTANLLELAKKWQVKQFILASSSSVYGERANGPFGEKDRTDKPRSPYAASKKAAELICRVYADIHRVPVTVVRIFNAYGPRNRPDMACFRFLEALLSGKPLEVYGDGSVGRDYTFVGDIVGGLIKVLENPKRFDIVNLGGSTPITINELIKALEKVTGKDARVKYVERFLGDVPLTFAGINHAEKVYAWKPETTLNEGLSILQEWYLKEICGIGV